MGASNSGVWRLGANFEVFFGQVYNDLNQNGVKDNGEAPMKNTIISAEPLGSYTATDDSGNYSLVAASMLDSIHVTLPNAYCSALPPSRLEDLQCEMCTYSHKAPSAAGRIPLVAGARSL